MLAATWGSPAAIKVLTAAHLGGLPVGLTAPAPASTQQQQPFALSLPNSVVIRDANTAALIVGGQLAQQGSCASLVSWLEWEAATLTPALHRALVIGPEASSQLTAALERLSRALSNSNGWALPGQQPSVADVVLYWTLQPCTVLKAHIVLPQPISTWFHSVATLAATIAAVTQACQGQEQSAWQEALCQQCLAQAQQAVAGQPLRPKAGQRNILITSALPYVNNVPHLGNIIGCVLSADCYARYCRARGYNTVFVCGTDEYGTATETKALEEGLSCDELCDKYHAIHAAVYKWFNIQCDKFGRTPSRWQTSICQDIFKQLKATDCLREQTMEQLYSVAAGKFLADRFVTGTCPKCRYEDARGDQCDGCGALLNPAELINPKCKLTGTKPEIRSTKHLFLDLPKLTPQLQQYIDITSAQGGWTSNCVQTTAAWMRDGLKPRCITRDLKWGTPVPEPGYESKVFYVWFDAPIGYISITAQYTPHWREWWLNPEGVEMVQFMGKDNVPFHTVIFPSTLLGTAQPWTLMKSISVTEYLNYEGGKFSKSRGTGVFGTDAQDTGIAADVWRFYLLSVRPEQQDTDFKWSDLQAKNNSELMANLGNFINRGLQFAVKFFDGQVPAGHVERGRAAVLELGAAVAPKVQEYVAAMERQKLREGLRLTLAISADGNKFIQDNKPWVVVKTDAEHCGTIVRAVVGVVRLLAALLAPFMPQMAQQVLSQLALPPATLSLSDEVIKMCEDPSSLAPPGGHALGTPSPLVTVLPDTLITELKLKYQGNQ